MNVDTATDFASTYSIKNGYLIKVYGNKVLDPGPLGLSRHGSELQYGIEFTQPNVHLPDLEIDLPGDEMGQFTSTRIDNAFRGQLDRFVDLGSLSLE